MAEGGMTGVEVNEVGMARRAPRAIGRRGFAHQGGAQIRFWKPESASVIGMLRVEREDQGKTSYAEHFAAVVVYEGAFDGWYRGAAHRHVAGSLKLKEPGQVHRPIAVHAPFTIQGALFAPETIVAAADALGVRGRAQFKAANFAPGERATALAFRLHDALVRADATEIERESLVAELLGEIVGPDDAHERRAPLAVRRARAFLHDAVAGNSSVGLADKITLDALADHAGLDKFHLVRAFHAEVGLPPYEYLTYLRVARARALLERGVVVAEAAQAVGFCDESQLHRHFRRIVGVPPGAYARALTSASAQGAGRAKRHAVRARAT